MQHTQPHDDNVSNFPGSIGEEELDASLKGPDDDDDGEPLAAQENNFHETLDNYREEQSEQEESGEEEKQDIYSLQPTEFIEMYKQLTPDDKKHLYQEYKNVLEIRDNMTEKMAELKAWCEEKNIDFPTYKAVYKRAHNPKKKQNMMDATFVFFGKELGGGLQRELFDNDTVEDEDAYND